VAAAVPFPVAAPIERAPDRVPVTDDGTAAAPDPDLSDDLTPGA
jgi:hypothetical protein